MPRANEEPGLGVVAIGRNEGERLRRCLASVLAQCSRVVYVDSGSKDGSVALARTLGAEVVELDTTVPFTAARARNAGFERLRELHPALDFVQFVDGDCELQPGWIPSGLSSLRARPELAAVCGRRRERFRNATVYNRLCDIEWNTPVGEVESCGGDVLMRVAAFVEAGRFDPALICGEEPDLCRRLRARGHVILRIEAEMTLHDAAMTRLSQWWRRSMRSGFAAAEAILEHGRAASRSDWRRLRGVLIWAAIFPLLLVKGLVAATLLESAEFALLVALGAFLLLLIQTLRIAARRDSRGENAVDASLYALSCMAEKLPQGFGMLRCWRLRRRRVTPQLIEYK